MNNRNMTRILVLKVLVAGLIVASIAGPAPAHAETCAAHLAKHGTSATADRAFHAAHGGESPCEEEVVNDRVDSSDNSRRGDESTRSRDDSSRPRRDRFGYHCKWTWTGLRCG